MCDNHIDVLSMFSIGTNDEDSKAESSHKKITHIWYHLSSLRVQARKKDPKVNKLRYFSIIFYGHF